MTLAVGLMVMAAAVMVGCGPVDPDDPTTTQQCVTAAAPQSATSIELIDDELRLEFGPQGGSHIGLSARLFVQSDSDLIISFDINGENDSQASNEILVEPCASGWLEVDTRVFGWVEGAASLLIRVADSSNNELAVYQTEVSVH